MSGTTTSRHVLLAYDDIYSIEYLNQWLRPYWRRNGMTRGQLLAKAEREYCRWLRATRKFDDALTADLRRVGGEEYAALAALAFRQTIAAHKLVADIEGTRCCFQGERQQRMH